MTPQTMDKAAVRGAARLAAVQALYQIDATGAAAEAVLAEFLEHRLAGTGHGAGGPAADRDFFADLLRGVAGRLAELDALISPALAEGWVLERMERVVRAILRAGTYELLARPDVPARVAINEYVDLAHAFFEGKEPGFVNGILDRLARQLRAGELEPQTGDEKTDSR